MWHACMCACAQVHVHLLKQNKCHLSASFETTSHWYGELVGTDYPASPNYSVSISLAHLHFHMSSRDQTQISFVFVKASALPTEPSIPV